MYKKIIIISFLVLTGFTSLVGASKLGVSSFEMINGIIFVEAELNGEEGTYIVDTGAPVLLLNQVAARGRSIEVQSASGDQIVNEVKVATFEWAGVKKKNIKAWALDLSHLEKSFYKQIDGVIGFDILKEHKLVFDILNSNVRLVKDIDPALQKVMDQKSKLSLEINQERPYFKISIGKKKLKFCLDTGAEINILDQKIAQQLNPANTHHFGKSKLISFKEGNSIEMEKMLINEIELEKLTIQNSTFSPLDLKTMNADGFTQMDGIVGLLFFQSPIIILDYPNKKLYF